MKISQKLLFCIALLSIWGCSKTCPKCTGEGTTACHTCYGTGKENCYYCKGDGKVDCSTCSGHGTTRCSNCYGEGVTTGYGYGYTTSGYQYYYGKHECSSCYGKGSKQCYSCSGSGTQNCTYCSYSGKKTCTSCNGNLTETCTQCGGNGSIKDDRTLGQRWDDFWGSNSKTNEQLTTNDAEILANSQENDSKSVTKESIEPAKNILYDFSISSQTRAEQVPQDVILLFLTSLDKREYGLAYDLTWVDRFEKKGKEWFMSCKAYGCTYGISLSNIKEMSNDGIQTKYLAEYTTKDDTNGAGSYSQIFTIQRKGEENLYFITDIRNLK